MSWELEWRMWRQLRGAFTNQPADMRFIFTPSSHVRDGYTFDQADSIKQAMAVLPADCTRVFLEPTGHNNIADIPRDCDIALILGNTESGNMALARPAETYHIATPGSTDIYGINAAAIALSYWYGQ